MRANPAARHVVQEALRSAREIIHTTCFAVAYNKYSELFCRNLSKYLPETMPDDIRKYIGTFLQPDEHNFAESILNLPRYCFGVELVYTSGARAHDIAYFFGDTNHIPKVWVTSADLHDLRQVARSIRAHDGLMGYTDYLCIADLFANIIRKRAMVADRQLRGRQMLPPHSCKNTIQVKNLQYRG
jgi:hypothetical protein